MSRRTTTPEKLAALKQAGARTADRPAAAVTPGGIVVTMVSNDKVLKELVAGNGGVAAALGAGTHVSMSTISPDTARELAKLHSRYGGHYLAAPVFGLGDRRASRGQYAPISVLQALRDFQDP